MADHSLTIIVEHLDPELEDWQALEYKCIAEECDAANATFLLSGLQSATGAGTELSISQSSLTEYSVETLYPSTEKRQRICLLDPKAETDLCPDDSNSFDVFLFGGILGDDPPRDRTGELRKLGFSGRRLGTEQMTTDTAARVTRLVIQGKKRLEDIPYVDRPDLELPRSHSEKGVNPSESVSMPFRYVKDSDGQPVLPKGMLDLLARDADKDILDLL